MLTRYSRGISSQAAISIGLICLVLSNVIEHCVSATNGTDFLVGMLVGLSITMNLWGLISLKTQRVRSGR
jgi:hypothetical protein